MEAAQNKIINFFADNGLPLPLIRHRGRGDLVASIVVLFAGVVALMLLFGGSKASGVLGGVTINLQIPGISGIGDAAAAIIAVLGALFGYLKKRKDDIIGPPTGAPVEK